MIPITSIKPDSSTPVVPYEYDIEEYGGVMGRMHLDDIRCVDKMRVIENKGYISVVTKREDIEDAVQKFLGFSSKSIGVDEE